MERAAPRTGGTAKVYLDVSGSMNAEMPQIIALLGRLSRYIRRPFWAFSDWSRRRCIKKRPACGADDRRHEPWPASSSTWRETRPAAAVVLTDGYIERLDRVAVQESLPAPACMPWLRATAVPPSSPAPGIPYTQLDKVPS